MRYKPLKASSLPNDTACVVTLRHLKNLMAKIAGQRRAIRSKDLEIEELRETIEQLDDYITYLVAQSIIPGHTNDA